MPNEAPTANAGKVPPLLLDLPNDEMATLCKALSPDRVSYLPASVTKQIARTVSTASVIALSPVQRHAAILIAWRYRIQMPVPVLASLSRWPVATFRVWA